MNDLKRQLEQLEARIAAAEANPGQVEATRILPLLRDQAAHLTTLLQAQDETEQ